MSCATARSSPANRGFQDLDAKRPVDDDTIYHWASITKTFTGIAIMQLRDRGLLSLDDPVVKYVPEFALVHDPYGESQMKIRHLMSHSAGLRASTWPWGGDNPGILSNRQRGSSSSRCCRTPTCSSRRHEVQLLESRRDFPRPDHPAAFRRRLRGLRHQEHPDAARDAPPFFDRAPYYLLPHRSHSYLRTDDGLTEARFDFDTGITVSNGGLNSPFDDMAKYLAFLIGDDRGRRVRGRAETSVARGDVDAADSRLRGRRRERRDAQPRCRSSSNGTPASNSSATAAIRTASSPTCTCIARPGPRISCR